MLKPIWSNTDINLEIPTERRPTEEEYREAEILLQKIRAEFGKIVEAAFLALNKKRGEEQERERQSQPPQPPAN